MKMYSALKKEFKALSVHCRLLFDQVILCFVVKNFGIKINDFQKGCCLR